MDKYIIEKIFHNNFEECKQYLIGYTNKNENALQNKFKEDGFRALDYKVHIAFEDSLIQKEQESLKNFEEIKTDNNGAKRKKYSNGQPKKDEYGAFIYDRQNFPSFFGNIDKETLRKELIVHKKIKVNFICYNKALSSFIETNFAAFLHQNNFGTRQSKGFGSFYIDESDSRYVDNGKFSRFHFTVDVSNKKFTSEFLKYKELFHVVDLFYKTLRSGINLKGKNREDVLYFKSLMFMYAKQLNPPRQWDKRTLRESLYPNHKTYKEVKRKRTDPNGTVQYNKGEQSNLLFRDLLGLSTEQDWMNYGEEKKDNNGKTIIKNGEISYAADKLTKKESSADIARFRSPITFKPIREMGMDKFIVHIFTEKIPQKYLGRTFTATSNTWKTSVNLMTPTDFDINDYLEFCFKAVFKDSKAFERHVDGNVYDNNAKLLMSIYDELRKQ